MAVVYPGTDSVIAHEEGVKGAVLAETTIVKAAADALFAKHNNPGGHEIEQSFGVTDGLVTMTGPAPVNVEWGRPPNAEGKGRMEGLHILGRAAGL